MDARRGTKLLHLAKIMPCQWRTIAPIVGRTAAQCLEHYQNLLDKVHGELAGEQEAAVEEESANVRKLRPGEVDVNPEHKPAIPDAVDMDDEEKEMISEARARLANTMGKKAKRKARQRQLEEAKRASNLNKRKELQEVGLNFRGFALKQKGLNYNAEIPFQMRAPEGSFDTKQELLDEKQREKKQAERETEKHQSRQNAREQKQLKEKSDRELRIRRIIRDCESRISKRPKMNLLQPGTLENHAVEGSSTPNALTPGRILAGLAMPLHLPQTPSRSGGNSLHPQTPSRNPLAASSNRQQLKKKKQESEIAKLFKALPPPKNEFQISAL